MHAAVMKAKADDPMNALGLLPLAGRLAWWGTSWLRGHVGPDDLLDAVLAGDEALATKLIRRIAKFEDGDDDDDDDDDDA